MVFLGRIYFLRIWGDFVSGCNVCFLLNKIFYILNGEKILGGEGIFKRRIIEF